MTFCLVPNRRVLTNVELFQRLTQEATINNKKFDPKCVISDFEPGLVSAVRTSVCFSFVFALKISFYSYDFQYF